ncbi:hypothetical protein [Nonomuraea sp. NPDC049695]|uniref:hypothetical protein n=1 Tax=Nonomuraea sp. NPDC049695 TaxID=3154734 RepID=UPI0034486B50
MRFRATIELGGKTATGFEVPAEVVEGLGGGKRPWVTVTILRELLLFAQEAVRAAVEALPTN